MTIRQVDVEQELRTPSSVLGGYLRKTVSISYLLGLVWAGRLIVIVIGILGMLYGIYTVHRDGPSYIAKMHVSPAAADTGGGGLSGMAAGAGGLLASLTGGAGTMQVPKFTQFLFAKGSEGVAEELNRRYDMLCRIYKGECDPVTHQLKKRRVSTGDWFDILLARLGGLPDPTGPRGARDLANYVRSSVLAVENKTNAMVELDYTSSKPAFAAEFLADVVKVTNDYIRAQSRETQKRYVDYLTASAASTANVEQRGAIDSLLLQEERQLMMTEVDIPYAANILDGPTVTPVNDALKRIAIKTLIGVLLGILIAASRDLLPRKWRVW